MGSEEERRGDSHPFPVKAGPRSALVIIAHIPLARTQSHGREGNGTPLQDSCPESPVDGGAWWAAVHGIAQSWTRLKRLSMHACIGEGNGNNSSILAWRIPGTEEPGGLPSMGSHRIGHD